MLPAGHKDGGWEKTLVLKLNDTASCTRPKPLPNPRCYTRNREEHLAKPTLTLIAPMLNKVAPVTKHATKNKTSGDESGLIKGTITYLGAA